VEPIELAWMSKGSCRNYPPSAFFPSDGVGVDAARTICADCRVQSDCLEYALENRIDHGVWGGCSERERRRILKRRRDAAPVDGPDRQVVAIR
jgi:WhiB family redox-sensing transcriptional regulator